MAKKFINNTHIEGVLYQHDLALKVSGENSKNPGTEFISGIIEIATDNAGVNIVPVHFTYVTAMTFKGKPNDTFNTLKNIIKLRKCYVRNQFFHIDWFFISQHLFWNSWLLIHHAGSIHL